MTYKIRFADGAVLENLEMNGNTYISHDVPVTDAMLNEEALKEVVITDSDGNSQALKYAGYDKIFHEEDGWHFVLWGAGAEQIRYIDMKKDMEDALNSLLDFVIGGE